MSKITTVVAKNANADTVAILGIDLAKNALAIHDHSLRTEEPHVSTGIRR